ncbi:MAG: ribonuclease H-like domain-containing protein [Bryobacteraceae bacterium]
METPDGRHWEMQRAWPAHYRHGVSDVGALIELPPDILSALLPGAGAGQEPPIDCPPERWAFLDTETTGLAGGSGTLAFLVGVGSITPRGFALKQYFLRQPAEEASLLAALAADLTSFDVLITYNGKAFDVPLLETRFLMNRRKPPFPRLQHVDLLYGARRLWRLKLESCRLQDLEQRILGHERVGDVGGAFIPNLYFDYLRRGDARPLEPIFFHNAIDILSLACLTAVVPQAFREPARLKHGAELAGLARWLCKEDRLEEAVTLMRLALARPMSDALVWETLWRLADSERKLHRLDAAVVAWSELSQVRNPFQAQAWERLALHYERVEKNLAMALECTRAALAIERTPELEKRAARLFARLSKPRPGKLL